MQSIHLMSARLSLFKKRIRCLDFFALPLHRQPKRKALGKRIYILLRITLVQTLQKLTNTIILQSSKAQQ